MKNNFPVYIFLVPLILDIAFLFLILLLNIQEKLFLCIHLTIVPILKGRFNCNNILNFNLHKLKEFKPCNDFSEQPLSSNA